MNGESANEVANVLWVKQREGISKEKAVEIMKDLESISLPTKTAFELMKQAQLFSYKYDMLFALYSSKHQLIDALTSTRQTKSIYDAMFLALAHQHSCEFITADKKLYNKVKGQLSWLKLL